MNSQTFRRVTGWLIIGVILAALFLIVEPFLVSLAWAAVLAIFFFRLHRRIRRRFRGPNKAALVTVALLMLLLVIPVISLVPALISQGISLASLLSSGDWLSKARVALEHYMAVSPVPLGDIPEIIDEISQKARAVLAEQSARLAGNLARSIFDVAVMLFAMFYLFRDGERVVELLRDISPWGAERGDRIMKEVTDLVQVTISSGFIVAGVQGVLGGLMFWILGLPSPVFWGVLMMLMAFLPIVGPWIVWGPAAVALLLAGETGRGIALAALGLLVVSGADNVLRPVLIAGRSQLNGLLVFVSVLGGIQALGFIGVVLGPLVVATAVGLLRGYHESLEKERRSAPGGAGSPPAAQRPAERGAGPAATQRGEEVAG